MKNEILTGILEEGIITGISYLKSAKKRPSMQEIYKFIKRRNYDIAIESFKESFEETWRKTASN